MIEVGIFIFVMGLIMGSFLNVCICRIPEGQSISYPPSHCSNCNTRLKPWDLVPVLSYVFLRGKCRYCKSKVSIQYPAMEVLTGIVYLLIYMRYGLTSYTLRYIILASFLIVIAMIDFKTTDIYDATVIIPAVIGIGFMVYDYLNHFNVSSRIFGVILALFIIGAIILITKAMGTGDLEVYMLIALYVGFKGTIFVILTSIIIGGIVGLILIATKKKTKKDFIPFGPYIVIAGIIFMIYGNQILNWYLSLIGI